MALPDTQAFNVLLESFTLREPQVSDGFLFRTCLADEQVSDQGRSRYVHAGQEIDRKLWDECEKVCREVAICYLAGMVSQGEEFTHQNWLKLLDLLIAQQDLGVALSAEALASAGISSELRFELFDRGFSDVEGLAHQEERDKSRK